MDLRRIAAVSVAGLALAGLAACSGPAGAQPGGGTAADPPATAASSPYCQKAPPSVVGSALGLPVGKQVVSIDGRVHVCAYQGRAEVLVRFQVAEDASQFRLSRQSLRKLHQTVSGVHGLGDQAYFARFGSGQQRSNTLAARKGALAIFVTAPKPLASERTLMTTLLAKF